ncbi:MAG: trypsin-like peptidase domain-containing protein [Ilumatobacteraceae bacterium]
MTQESAVILNERPAYEPPSFPPPTTPPMPPPGDWYLPSPSLPPRRSRPRASVVVLALIVAVATASAIVVESHRSGSSTAATPATSAKPATTVTTPSKPTSTETLPTVASSPPSSATPLDTQAIVALVNPAVVDITTTVDGGEAAGTGMVLTASGLVLTNNHVIDGATTVGVQIAGSGPVHKAHVVGYDVTDDVALVQIEGVSGLTTITVGDSSALAVGDRVVAIGNALGSSGPHAVSTGAIDALDQAITVDDPTGSSQDLSGLIQLDAGLQPGDSGGPLVNSAGQVIGMDTAASAGRRRVSVSRVGYAIPIEKALDVAKQIQAGKSSSTVHVGDRAVLGIQVTDANSLTGQGVTVVAVTSGSPAAGAGMQRGATITAIGSTTIGTVDELGKALFTQNPGDRVQVTWTDTSGTSHTATVQLIAGSPA